jgi:hypothetical protein
VYADQTGVTFEDACATEAQLRPFIDALLAAQQAAAAQEAGDAACDCPECSKAEPVAPEPAPAPAEPVITPAVPTETAGQ